MLLFYHKIRSDFKISGLLEEFHIYINVVQGPVLIVGRYPGNGIHHIHSADYPSENGMVIVQMMCPPVGLDNEKFKRGRGLADILLAVFGGRKGSTNMLMSRFELTWNQIISYFGPFSIGIRIIGISSLNHKVFCHAMKEGIFEVVVFHQINKISPVQRRIVE